ncbi:TetR family transcriptional regulator [Streptomyces sp. NPDC058307]|uniref:TetR family transcriptional regulator n=1 Tax=Streptomyces sp. NPDC058307 TaxID=3346439 RepID=UPI0036E951FF
MEQIAAAAGVAVGTLYKHFPNKNEGSGAPPCPCLYRSRRARTAPLRRGPRTRP